MFLTFDDVHSVSLKNHYSCTQDFTVGRIQHFQADGLPYGKLRRPGREDLTILKLNRTIDLSFGNHLSAACYPTCDDMFDVEFKVCTALLSVELLPGGAATCSEGFVICFPKVPPAGLGSMAAAVQHKSLGNFQKKVNKTFRTSGRPTRYIPSRSMWQLFCDKLLIAAVLSTEEVQNVNFNL